MRWAVLAAVLLGTLPGQAAAALSCSGTPGAATDGYQLQFSAGLLRALATDEFLAPKTSYLVTVVGGGFASFSLRPLLNGGVFLNARQCSDTAVENATAQVGWTSPDNVADVHLAVFVQVNASYEVAFAVTIKWAGNVCPSGQFRSAPKTCQPCTPSCSAGKFLDVRCSTLSDNLCRTCPAGTFKLDPGAQTECKPCRTCEAGEYQTRACSATLNRQCAQCTTCISTFMREVRACAGTQDRTCEFTPERQVLQDLLAMAGNSGIGNWGSNTGHCNLWDGIMCDTLSQGSITHLTINASSLSNGVAPSLAPLTKLVELRLVGTNMAAPAIKSLGIWSMPLLQTVDLRQNKLAGTLTGFAIKMPALKTLILSNNNLAGPLPALTGAPQLTDLRLDGNFFSGPVLNYTASHPQVQKKRRKERKENGMTRKEME